MAYKKSVYASASEDRLEKLIQERLDPHADKGRIDQRIWDLFGEVWCVMFTDLSGFSRGVARFGIIHFLQMIHESERLLIPRIEAHDGILLKAEEDKVLLCVGLGYGRVLRIGDADVFGNEVNAASKLGEDTAKADEILVTGAVRNQSTDFTAISFEPIEAEIPGAASAFKVIYTL